MGSLTRFRKTPHDHCFGVEIECYPVNEYPDDKHLGFFWVTLDGSLEWGGREFVSQPLPYNFLSNRIKWLWKTVDGWSVREECGLHIHVSRALWPDSRQMEFSKMLRRLERDQMRVLFGRSSQYADPHSHGKYRAINIQHMNSYEFRVWKAGDLNWTLEALRRTKLIVSFKGKYTYEKMLKLFEIGELVGPPAPSRSTRILRVRSARNLSLSEALRYVTT